MRDARAAAVSGWPSRTISPESYGSTPARHSKSVVLPAPFGPMSPSTSPERIDSDTSDSAVRRPYAFVRRSTTTIESGICNKKVYRWGRTTTSSRNYPRGFAPRTPLHLSLARRFVASLRSGGSLATLVREGGPLTCCARSLFFAGRPSCRPDLQVRPTGSRKPEAGGWQRQLRQQPDGLFHERVDRRGREDDGGGERRDGAQPAEPRPAGRARLRDRIHQAADAVVDAAAEVERAGERWRVGDGEPGDVNQRVREIEPGAGVETGRARVGGFLGRGAPRAIDPARDAGEIGTGAHDQPLQVVARRDVRALVLHHRGDFSGRALAEHALGHEQPRAQDADHGDDRKRIVDREGRQRRVEAVEHARAAVPGGQHLGGRAPRRSRAPRAGHQQDDGNDRGET